MAEELCHALGLASPLLVAEAPDASLWMEGVGDAPLDADGREVLAVLRRGDPRDGLLVSADHVAARADEVAINPALLDPADPLRALGEHAVVAAHGPLRCAQITITRPDLQVLDLKGGDLDVLHRWQEGGVDAAVLPSALLDRAGLTSAIRRRLDPPWIAAPGAGGVWLRGAWDAELRELVLPLDDRASRLEFVAECAVADALGVIHGVSLGVHASVGQSRLDLRATLVHRSQPLSIAAKRQGEATMRGAQRLAAMLVRDLRERGAGVLGQ